MSGVEIYMEGGGNGPDTRAALGLGMGVGSRRVEPRAMAWVKMGQQSLGGLRVALLDAALLSDPKAQPRLAIEELRVGKARCAARSESLQVRFSAWMSVLVVGRGTGKSTLVEGLRLSLDRVGELREDARHA